MADEGGGEESSECCCWKPLNWVANKIASPLRLQDACHDDAVNYVAACINPPDNFEGFAKPPRVITAGEDGQCLVFEPINKYWMVTQVLKGHSEAVYSVAIADEADIVVSSSADKTLRVWRADDEGTLVNREDDVLHGHTDAVHYCTLNGNATLIASAGADHTVRIWRYRQTQSHRGEWIAEHTLVGHTDKVYGLTFSPDYTLLLSGSQDTNCIVWEFDGAAWAKKQVLSGHTDSINAVNMSLDCSTALTASSDGSVRVWAQQDQGIWLCVQVLQDHEGDVYDAAISDDMTLLATCGADHYCRLYTVKFENGQAEWHKKQKLRHHGDIWGVRIEPHKALEGSGSDEGEIVGEHGARTPGRRSEHIIATGSSDKSATLWRWDGKAAYQQTSIRYASDYEIAWKVISLTIKALQKAKFAFSADVPWKSEPTRPINWTLKFSMFDFHLPINIPSRWLVALNALGSALLVLIFFLLAFKGAGKRIVSIISTLCVVPIIKAFADVFACENGVVPATNGQMECGGLEHIAILAVCVPACLLYFLLLLPFTAGDGDLEVMPRHVWCRPSEWVKRKTDKIRGLDLGRMTPARGTILYQYANLIAGIGLPISDAFTVLDPLTHGYLVLGFSAVPLLSAVCWAPFQDPIVNSVVIAIHFVTFNSFAAGLYALWLNAKYGAGAGATWGPILILFGGWVLIGIVCLCVIQLQPRLTRRDARVVGLRSSMRTNSRSPSMVSMQFPSIVPSPPPSARTASPQAVPTAQCWSVQQGAGYPPQQPYGAAPPYSQQPGAQALLAPAQPQYGQPQYQPQYGVPVAPQYGQPQYGQPQYGQPQYGQPVQQGPSSGHRGSQRVRALAPQDLPWGQAFIAACWQEYVCYNQQEVGRFLNSGLPPHLLEQFEYLEEHVLRRSADKAGSIHRLAAQLGVAPQGGGRASRFH